MGYSSVVEHVFVMGIHRLRGVRYSSVVEHLFVMGIHFSSQIEGCGL